jgi:hypothetical protein
MTYVTPDWSQPLLATISPLVSVLRPWVLGKHTRVGVRGSPFLIEMGFLPSEQFILSDVQAVRVKYEMMGVPH